MTGEERRGRPQDAGPRGVRSIKFSAPLSPVSKSLSLSPNIPSYLAGLERCSPFCAQETRGWKILQAGRPWDAPLLYESQSKHGVQSLGLDLYYWGASREIRTSPHPMIGLPQGHLALWWQQRPMPSGRSGRLGRWRGCPRGCSRASGGPSPKPPTSPMLPRLGKPALASPTAGSLLPLHQLQAEFNPRRFF